jgi:hypothetical protein
MQNKKLTTYTPELTEKLIKLYEEYGPEKIDEIATQIEKSKKSVIAKLVRLDIYKPANKPASKRSSPSKKELLNELEAIVKFDVSGLTGASKPAIQNLLNYIKSSIN